MSNWSELPHDLLVEIAACIEKLEGFIAFGAVCKRWFEVGKKRGYFKGLWLRQGTPYLLLPVRYDNVDNTREFYSLVEGETVASLRIPKFGERKCHESLGWLLAVENDGTMCLLDPFTSVEIPLPHQSTFPEYGWVATAKYVFVQNFVLSARPSETSDFIVMIVGGHVSNLAFWRPGDESWNIIGIKLQCFRDVIYYGGHFYAIDVHRRAWIHTLEGDNLPGSQMVTQHQQLSFHSGDTLYILKTSESLFMIVRIACGWHKQDNRTFHNTVKFWVYEVHMPTNAWVEIDSVGSMAIFVGLNTTFAIDTCRRSFGNIKGNHIYFTDDDDGRDCLICEEKGGGKDMGAYNMESKTVESFFQETCCLTKCVCPSGLLRPFSFC